MDLLSALQQQENNPNYGYDGNILRYFYCYPDILDEEKVLLHEFLSEKKKDLKEWSNVLYWPRVNFIDHERNQSLKRQYQKLLREWSRKHNEEVSERTERILIETKTLFLDKNNSKKVEEIIDSWWIQSTWARPRMPSAWYIFLGCALSEIIPSITPEQIESCYNRLLSDSWSIADKLPSGPWFTLLSTLLEHDIDKTNT